MVFTPYRQGDVMEEFAAHSAHQLEEIKMTECAAYRTHQPQSRGDIEYEPATHQSQSNSDQDYEPVPHQSQSSSDAEYEPVPH